MSDSYDGTSEETDNSEQKYVIFNQKRFRNKREKPVSYFENVRCYKNWDVFLAGFAIYETEFLN